MKILIVGGCGYIGSRLCEEFWNEEVHSVDLEWYGKFFEKNKKIDFKGVDVDGYDWIILVYGQSSMKMSEGQFISVYKNKVRNFVSLLEKIKKCKVKPKLIFASSCRVYYGSTGVSKESDVQFTSPHPYDISKYLCEIIVRNYDIEYYALRFGTVNGWSYNFRTESLINSMFTSYKNDGVIHVSNGSVGRAVLDMDDLIRAVKTIVAFGGYEKRGSYNLCSFNGTVAEIGKEVATILGCPLEDRGNDSVQMSFAMDCSKFEKAFDFRFMGSVGNILGSISNKFDYMTKTDRNKAVRYV